MQKQRYNGEVAFRKTRKLARKEKSKLTMEVPE